MKKYHNSSGIDIDNFTRLQIDLVDQQRQLRELQEFIEAKENEKNKRFKSKILNQKKLLKYMYIRIYLSACIMQSFDVQMGHIFVFAVSYGYEIE